MDSKLIYEKVSQLVNMENLRECDMAIRVQERCF